MNIIGILFQKYFETEKKDVKKVRRLELNGVCLSNIILQLLFIIILFFRLDDGQI